jgi:diketogulonate reductase-like aldo/keto reductase
VLAEIAARHGATAHQVILSFLTRDKAVFAIPKAARREHTQENAGAANVALTKTDVAAIDAAFGVPR